MKRHPRPLAFHGVDLRARDPKALARRLREILGWKTLRETSREIVLGEGPELFVRIVPAARGERDGVAEVHLAVEDLAKTRLRTQEDALGGDSRTEAAADGLSLTLREFRRAPGARWRRSG